MISLPIDVATAIETGTALVVPSRQRAQAVQLAWAAGALRGGRGVWRTPDCLPIGVWLAREIERRAAAGDPLPRLLAPAEEWLLWRQSTAAFTEELELAARGPLAEALRRASEVALTFGIETARLGGAAGSEVRLLHAVQREVSERRRQLGAASALEIALAAPFLGGPQPLLLAGFTRLPPYCEGLVAKRRAQGYLSGTWEPVPAAEPGTRTVFAADPREEHERIATWCHARLRASPHARLLVVLPGGADARERLVTLIRQEIDPRAALDAGYNAAGDIAALEGGAPLARAPLAAHALQCLAWLTHGADFAAVSAWLRAPFWVSSDATRARLDLWLRETASLQIDPPGLRAALGSAPGSLRAAAAELSARIAMALDVLGRDAASPRQWSERFRAALAALGWPGSRPLGSEDEQTRARWTELLDEFGHLATAAPRIERTAAVQWLGELAARTAFRAATGDPLVTVSPFLADPIVRYDGIWVAGLHADAWPPPVQPDPFLPLAAQIAAGVPAASAAGRTQEARQLLRAWQCATAELVLSAPLRAEDVQLSASPLLAGYAAAGGAAAGGATAGCATAGVATAGVATAGGDADAPAVGLPRRVRCEGRTESLVDEVGVVWNTAHPLPSGSRSVELQNTCPFRAYAELRLSCAELEVPQPGIDPAVRGKLLHAALERLWSVLQGSAGLAAHTAEGLQALIARCVAEAADLTFRGAPESGRSRAQRRECRRTQRLMHDLCELERARAPFSVRGTEVSRALRVGGARLSLRIDRLDALAAGGLAILDYKSGRAVPGDWYGERPSHPQLLAYLAAVGDEAVAMATVSVTARETRFDGVAATAGLLPGVRPVQAPSLHAGEDPWAARRREWLARVESLALDFMAGRARVDPLPHACDYCEVARLCRIADATRDEPDDELPPGMNGDVTAVNADD